MRAVIASRLSNGAFWCSHLSATWPIRAPGILATRPTWAHIGQLCAARLTGRAATVESFPRLALLARWEAARSTFQ